MQDYNKLAKKESNNNATRIGYLLFFDSNSDDRSVNNVNSFALQLCLDISFTQEHEAAAKRKSNVQLTRQSSLFRQLFCLLEAIMEPGKKTMKLSFQISFSLHLFLVCC